MTTDKPGRSQSLNEGVDEERRQEFRLCVRYVDDILRDLHSARSKLEEPVWRRLWPAQYIKVRRDRLDTDIARYSALYSKGRKDSRSFWEDPNRQGLHAASVDAAENLCALEEELKNARLFYRLDAEQMDCKYEMGRLMKQLNRFHASMERLLRANTEAAELFCTLRQPDIQLEQRISSRHDQWLLMRQKNATFCTSVYTAYRQRLEKLMERTQRQPTEPQGHRVARLQTETEEIRDEIGSLQDEWRLLRSSDGGALSALEHLLAEADEDLALLGRMTPARG